MVKRVTQCGMVGLLLALGLSTAALAGPGFQAGELSVDPPTLINLGFEWRVDGDDDRNAKVEVSKPSPHYGPRP